MNDNPDGTLGTLMIHPKIAVNRYSNWVGEQEDLLLKNVKTIGFELDVELVITKMNTLTFTFHHQPYKVKFPGIDDPPVNSLTQNRFEFGMRFYLHGLRQQ